MYLDQQLVLVKLIHWTSVCCFAALFSIFQHTIQKFSFCVHMYIWPGCLLSPCCCIYRVPYLNFQMIIMMKNSAWGVALIQGFKFWLFVFRYIAMLKDEPAWGSFVAPYKSHHDCLSVSLQRCSFFFLFFTIPVSVGLMYSPQDLYSC